jgi:hypothetical protein
LYEGCRILGAMLGLGAPQLARAEHVELSGLAAGLELGRPELGRRATGPWGEPRVEL